MQKIKATLKGDHVFDQTDVSGLQGRTALVTGGTNGIGFEVARGLALSKARVLLLSRKADKGEEAIEKIRKESNPTADIEFIECDLGNLKQVKEVADRIREKEPRLDLLIADAGIGVNKFDVTVDGYDRHFAVNHLGHYLLINRLLPLVRKTAAIPDAPTPRIILVASERHHSAPSDVKFASEEEITEKGASLGPNNLYARSKLATILFTKFGLVQRVLVPNGDRIIAVATHPGPVATDQPKQLEEAYGKVLGGIMKNLVVPFMRDPEQGSLSTLWAATSPEIEQKEWSGLYFTNPGEVGKESKLADDGEVGKNLWELSERMVTKAVGPDALLPWNEGVVTKF